MVERMAVLVLHTAPAIAVALLVLLVAFAIHWLLGIVALLPIGLGIGALVGEYQDAKQAKR